MKIRVYLICLLILLPFIGHAGLAQNPRDLTRYDDGGAFDGRQMMPKLRRFLWEHCVPSADSILLANSILNAIND
jgi:hypothetical protein